MVVQTVQEKKKAINYVKIPTKIPKEIIENDSLMVLEKGLNKLEDRITITARTVLSMNYELKTQIHEIDRLESAIVSMHEFIIKQQDKIYQLEEEVHTLKNFAKNNFETQTEPQTGFWSRLFSK